MGGLTLLQGILSTTVRVGSNVTIYGINTVTKFKVNISALLKLYASYKILLQGVLLVISILNFIKDAIISCVRAVGWLSGWVLWHLNLCRLFNAKSMFMQIVSSI